MKLGRFASEVYRMIAANDGLTAGELFMIYKSNHPNTIRSRNEVAKRVSDLKNADLVYEDGVAVCRLTNRMAAVLQANSIPDGITLSTEPAEGKTPVAVVENFDDEGSDSCQCDCGCPCSRVNSFGEGDIQCDEEVVDEFEPETLSPERVRDTSPRQLHELSREEKAKEISRLMQEDFLTMDKDDEAFLRECKSEIGRLMSHPLFKTLAPAELKDKAKKLEKALRYF